MPHAVKKWGVPINLTIIRHLQIYATPITFSVKSHYVFDTFFVVGFKIFAINLSYKIALNSSFQLIVKKIKWLSVDMLTFWLDIWYIEKYILLLLPCSTSHFILFPLQHVSGECKSLVRECKGI